MKQAAADLSAAQAVLFGEYHDQAEIHVAEVKLLEELYRLRGKKLALSLEMFEKDVQPTLNDYLTEKITETVFLENSRPWKNYQEAYKFLVDFAKAKELNVIAGNIPRYLAAKYAKDGSFDNFSET